METRNLEVQESIENENNQDHEYEEAQAKVIEMSKLRKAEIEQRTKAAQAEITATLEKYQLGISAIIPRKDFPGLIKQLLDNPMLNGASAPVSLIDQKYNKQGAQNGSGHKQS